VSTSTEPRSSERALRESEERFRSLLEATNDVIWDVDLGTRELKWTGAVQTMFGYSTDEVSAGGWWEDRLHPEDRGRVIARIEGAIDGDDDTWLDEYRFRCDDGSYAAVVDRAFVRRGEGGEAVRVVGSMMDVTERKQAEEKVRRLNENLEEQVARRTDELTRANENLRAGIAERDRAEEKYRSIFENAVEGIFQTSAEGRPLTANPAMARMLGYGSPEELLASVSDVGEQFYVDPARRAEFTETMRRHGIVSGFEAEFCRKDGSRIWVSYSARGVRGEGGELACYEGTVEDITERKRAEEALHKSEERFRSLVQNASDVVTVFDSEGVVRYQSDSVERVLGYPPGGMLGKHAFEYVHPDDLQRVSGSFTRLLERPGVRPRQEFRIRHADGSWRHFESIVNNLLSDPAVEGIVVISRDVTGRKEAEEELRESEAFARSTLNSLSAHIAILDETGLVLATNRAWQGFAESNPPISARAGTGANYLEVCDAARGEGADGGAAFARGTRDVIAGRLESFELEYPCHSPTERRWFVGRVTRFPGTHPPKVVVAHEDVTESKEAEEALRQSEELYRTVVEQAAEGIFLAEAETGRIIEVNAALRRSLGYAEEELEQLTLYDIAIVEQESVERTIGRIPENRSHFIGERQYRRKDGSPVDVEVSGSTITYDGREVLCIVAHDVTERIRAEERLREVREAERSRMARDLHDMVLQDLSYTAAAMEVTGTKIEDSGLAEELGKETDYIRRAVEGLRRAVYDLRSGDERSRPLPLLLEALVEQSRKMAPEADISLLVEEGFPQVPLGETGTQLLRVFQEALSNVRRHSGAGSVRVALGIEGDELMAEVADDGRGFSAGSATGVGMKSMRERTVALGGKLELDSGPGKGTRVRFRASISDLLRRAYQSETGSPETGTGEGGRK
jgi:PAS domain S-box-containing protein